jgi:hypothetical protein
VHFVPKHLRPRREKIFGPAPSHPLDSQAKTRLWAEAKAYNAAHKQKGQHWGPLTRTTMTVLRVLLWQFHDADGSGRCFPGVNRIADAADCCRDSVNVAIKALESAGLLTWVHRIARIRRRVRDLVDAWQLEWQVIRTSNAYQLLDPRRKACMSENPPGPQNRESKKVLLPVDNSPDPVDNSVSSD